MKYIFGVLSVSVIAIVLSSLIFWSLGNLIIWLFKINYTWTILHGLACALVYALLEDIF